MEREVPQSYEEALRVLEGSAHASVCKDAYREWRALGADVWLCGPHALTSGVTGAIPAQSDRPRTGARRTRPGYSRVACLATPPREDGPRPTTL